MPTTLSEFELASLGEIIAGNPHFDWFTCDLIRLIARADKENRAALRRAYPDHVRAIEDWLLKGVSRERKSCGA